MHWLLLLSWPYGAKLHDTVAVFAFLMGLNVFLNLNAFV